MRHPRLLFAFTFIILAGAYFLCLPWTVQSGDTGELVEAAANLIVPHPPGYPLFVWLQHFFITLVPWGSVFARASFLSALFSLGGLAFFWSTLKSKPWIASLVVLALGFSAVFWKFAVMPDVFSLNVLFGSAILYLYFSPHEAHRKYIPFLFCLGLTNHHTLIFLSPLVLEVLYKNRRQKSYYVSLAAGVLCFVGLYSSLLLLNTDHFSSWGHLQSLTDVLGHLLRSDYGTFQLMNTTEKTTPLWQNYYVLMAELSKTFAPFILILVLAAKQLRVWFLDRRLQMASLCLVLYGLVFFGLANSSHLNFQIEVFSRFTIFFMLIAGFVLGGAISKMELVSHKQKQIAGLLLLAFVIFQFARNYKINNFSKNTVIEDYVVNLLNGAAEGRKSVLVVTSDTRFFAARYAQQVLGVRPDVLILHPRSLFFPWFSDKVAKSTELKMDIAGIQKMKALDVQSDLILPNIHTYDFVTPFVLTDLNLYHVRILPLGRRISFGQGADIAFGEEKRLQLRSTATQLQTDLKTYDVSRELFSEYAQFWVIQARNLENASKPTEARQIYENILQQIPWCFPAAERIPEYSIEDMKQTYFNYYN